MLSNARVVLVRPHYPGNLGAVARVMCNFGLDQLTLVTPFADPRSEEARRSACQAKARKQLDELGDELQATEERVAQANERARTILSAITSQPNQ